MESIQNLSAKDQIIQEISRAIFSGAIKSGSELTQEEIAKSLSLSRIPVREALQQMTLSGIVERMPNRHVRVIGFTEKRIRQTIAVLCALEKELCTLRRQYGVSDKALTEIIAAFSSAENTADLEYGFHEILCDGLDNPALKQVHIRFLSGLFHYILFSSDRDRNVVGIQLKNFLSDTDIQQKGIDNYYNGLTELAIKVVLQNDGIESH